LPSSGAFPLNFDSNAKIAKNLMSFRQDDLGIDYVSSRNDLINAVTLDDVKRVAATYMKPENFTFVLVGQPK
jgi:zinc protease